MDTTIKLKNWLESQGEKDNWAEELNTKIKELDKKIQEYVNHCEGCNNVKGCVTCVDGDQWAKITKVNIKPKFKVGDWVINTITKKVEQVIELTDYEYICSGHLIVSFNNQHLLKRWITKDAKDGDVLVIQKTDVTYESIFIFKKIENNRIIQYLHYFTTDAGEEVCEARSIDGFIGFVGTNVHPATKEQRNTLMKAMADAGYTFDFEKKELKKINSYCQENCKGYQETGKCFSDGKCDAKRKAEQESSAWSKDDEQYLLVCKNALAKYQTTDKWDSDIIFNWLENKLKSLRTQTKKEWDKADKEYRDAAIYYLRSYCNPYKVKPILEWLEELEPKSHWKPSDEQLRELRCVISGCSYETPILIQLEQDLKKLL